MKPNNQKPNRWRWVSWLLYSVAFFLLAMWMFGGDAGSTASKELSYTKFVAYIENDAVKDITVYDDNRRVMCWCSATKARASRRKAK